MNKILMQVAAKRKNSTTEKVHSAIKKIEDELEQNDGIYQYNKGKLTQAEIARRAQIDKATLQKPQHHELREEIKGWLQHTERKLTQGRKIVRKSVTEQIEVWKSAYNKIAQNYAETELQLVDLKSEKSELIKRVSELEKQCSSLQEELNKGKVVNMKSRTKKN